MLAPATRYETVNTRDPISTADSVSVEDLIGRGPLVDHLVGVVEQLIQSTQDSSTQRGSCVIRIDAPWGSGKSTLLGLLEQGLKQRRAKVGEPIVVRFDAWRESQVGPEWWSLGGALYRGIKSERVLATRAAMAVSSAIDRVVRSKVVIGALVILAILAIAISWGPVAALATRWQLVLTTLTGVVAAAFALSRILFWSSPALGQLHQKADDAPLAEVARMVSKYRRWAPRQDTAHKLADTLLGTWLVLITLWATHHAFTDVRTRGLDAVASSLVIAAIGLGGVFLLTVAAKPAQPSPESPTSPAWQRVPYLLAALILGALFVGFSGLGSVLGGEFRDWARDLGDLDTRRWVVTAVLLLIAGLAIYITWLRRTIGSPRRPTLLAIDDLDRCTHEKTVAYLETIHTLIRHHAAPTSFPRWREPGALVVIVLADGRWVREAFSTQYDAFKDLGDPGVRSLGADFITKLFDHTVLIPELNEDQVKRYLDSLSKSQPLPDPEPIMSDPVPAPPDQDVATAPPPEEPDAPTPSADPAVELTDVLESVSSSQAPDELRTVSDRAATLPPLEQATAQAAIQDLRGSEQYVVELQRHLITAYSHVMPRNPRLIRRVANTWAMLEALQASIGIQGDEADLVHAAIFFVRYPTLVDTLLHSAAPPSGQDDVWIRADVLATRTQASGDVMSPEELAACYGKEFLAATPRQ